MRVHGNCLTLPAETEEETMTILEEIHERIATLRAAGVRMKDMAAAAGWTPNVFSALYSSVLPAYRAEVAKGAAPEAALDRALACVNNVSRRRLQATAGAVRDALARIEPPERPTPPATLPFQRPLAEAACRSAEAAAPYAGAYLSYSMSSSRPALKVEPYLIAPDTARHYIRVVHRSVYGAEHSGFALLNGPRHLYLSFNERRLPELALFTIYLQIPLFDKPGFLKGLYLSFDYNYNPIARRIVFVKQSADAAAFRSLEARLVPEDSLSQRERYFFDYTCQPADALRTCNVPSPRLDEQDLVTEKQILKI